MKKLAKKYAVERRFKEDYIELPGMRTIKHLSFVLNRNEGYQLLRYATVFSCIRQTKTFQVRKLKGVGRQGR